MKINAPADWRDKALKRAAAKYGKPFKCAARKFAREVMKAPGHFVTAEPHEDAVEQPPSLIVTDTVRQIKGAGK